MKTKRTAEQPRIVFCNCAHYEIIPRVSQERILAALSRANPGIEAVSDLCGLAADRDPRLHDWAAASSLAIVACFPRAVRWLFHAAGAPLSDGQVRLFNMRTQAPEEIAQSFGVPPSGGSESPPAQPAPHPVSAEGKRKVGLFDPRKRGTPNESIHHQSSWVPWFPVIDYERCKNCKQCLNFCLFGVYQLSEEGQVRVRNPAGCKTNCPACARMCPQRAIIFPKYGEPPINGDEVPVDAGPGAGPAEGQPRADAPAGDVYDRIRRRSAARQRFSTETQDPFSGQSCPTLAGLQRELGIPDSVLTSLSPAELQRIAAQKGPEPSPSDSRPNDSGKDKEHNG